MDQKPTPKEANIEFLDALARETRVSQDGEARGPPNLYDIFAEEKSTRQARCAPEPVGRWWEITTPPLRRIIWLLDWPALVKGAGLFYDVSRHPGTMSHTHWLPSMAQTMICVEGRTIA